MNKKMTVLSVMLLFGFTALVFSNGLEYQVDFNSSYIWRGFDLNPSHKPVLQPSVTYRLGKSGFALNVWASIDFEDKASNELDFTLSYDFKTNENLSLSAGFVHYGWYLADDFDFSVHTSQEFYLSLGFPNVMLTPGITVYYDINNGDGLYVLGAIGHSLRINRNHVLDLSASIGYNGGQWIAGNGFSDINFSAALPLKLGKISVTPSANLTFVLLDEVSTKDHFWVGLSIAF